MTSQQQSIFICQHGVIILFKFNRDKVRIKFDLLTAGKETVGANEDKDNSTMYGKPCSRAD